MHNKIPKVAFIIVCWNNKDLLKECLDSIRDQTYNNYSIILVDNGSVDDSVAFVSSHMPSVNIIEAKKNLGFAKGNNLGIEAALADKDVQYVALLNTDARISKDWLEQLVKFAEVKLKAACLQGTTLDYYNHEIIDSTHIFIARNGQGTQGSWRNIYEREFGPKKVFGVNAAACIITRRFIDHQPFKGKLFDETMFMYLEDVDLAARATVMGWDNYLVPGVSAYHMGSASSGKNPGFSLYMTFRNNSGLLFKNLPILMIIKLLPNLIRGDIDTIKALRLQGKDYAVRKVINGRFIGIIRLPLYLVKRYSVRKVANIPKEYLWRLMDKGF